MKELTSKIYPVGVSKFSIICFLVSGIAVARLCLGKRPVPAHELSMRRRAEMFGKETQRI